MPGAGFCAYTGQMSIRTGKRRSTPALLFLLPACLAWALPAAAQNGGVAFDWFHYEGRDAASAEPLRPGHYRNPVLAGFYPDPSIVRVGADYYLVTSSFAYFPGLPLFHSRDLVNWRQIGHALTRRSQLTFEDGQGVSRGIFAPTIRHHDGLFYIITTDVDGIGNFFITAEDPAGPWSDPVLLPDIRGIDPDLFFDDDGRVYIAHNGEPEGEPLYDGHRAIWLWQYDLAGRRVIAGSGRVIVDGGVDISRRPIWIEAPHLYRIDSWYYLVCAEGGTADQHSAVVFRTRSLEEPFLPWADNPILTQRDLDPDPGRPNPVTSTGHADLVQTPAGDWWAVFLGVRPYAGGFHNTGRETFLLPVRRESGWPRILDPRTLLPLQASRPAPQSAGVDIPPQSGDFIWRDEFDVTLPTMHGLQLNWTMLRTSERQWFALDAAAGLIRLEALPVSLADKAQPAFLARRQQHLEFAASTRLELPRRAGISAGLAAFQSSDFHYFVGVRKDGAAHSVFVEETRDGRTSVVASRSLAADAGGIVLGLGQSGATLDFHYATDGGEPSWLLRGADATLLSTQVAGGFVGVTLGIHARRD